MSFQFNPIGPPFDLVSEQEEIKIPQYFADPVSPPQESAWVRCKVDYPIISILSHTLLHFGLTTGEQKVVVPAQLQHTILHFGMTAPFTLQNIEDVAQYELRYRTKQNVTKGVVLT